MRPTARSENRSNASWQTGADGGWDVVTPAGTIHAEASVCALIRFSWRDPASGTREQGVFKVVKPQVPGHFAEEMALLTGLAEYLEKHAETVLSDVDLRATFAEIAMLLRSELETREEQANLQEAERRYGGMSGVRVPKFIAALSTDRITAMSYEAGVKATSAYRGDALRRQRLEWSSWRSCCPE